jgi:MoaA/NifB/PqqE/SkfB family radical SAM enzyme
MKIQSIYQTYKRYRSLQTDVITSLPLVILMPHSACNCRCIMCDIWKGNHNLKQLQESDISGLLGTLKKFGTQQVLMSGGEALLNPGFFQFCKLLKKENIRISVLSAGLTIKKHAVQLTEWTDELIVSLDGDAVLHDTIRNIPGAFQKLKDGIDAVRSIVPGFSISGRTVIHRLNYRHWPAIIDAAAEIGLGKISFLPADVSSNAFNREVAWTAARQHELLLAEEELPVLQTITDDIIVQYKDDFSNGFMAESPLKMQRIHDYYAAQYGHNPFPYKKCNAPWVSAVIEADGNVRPCFFHDVYGNIQTATLDTIINSEAAVAFRKNLDMEKNDTCRKCVCSLNLAPSANLF